jgi:hypothetical protein
MYTLTLKLQDFSELSIILGNRINQLNNNYSKDPKIQAIVARQLMQAEKMQANVEEILLNCYTRNEE